MTINLGTLNERKHTVLTFSQIYVYQVLICLDTWVGSCEGGYSTSVMCWLELQRWTRFLVLRNLLVTTECGVRILLSTPTLSLDSFLVTYIIFSLTIVFLVNLCACVICMCHVYVKTHGSQKKTRLGNWTRVLYKSSKPPSGPKCCTFVYLLAGNAASCQNSVWSRFFPSAIWVPGLRCRSLPDESCCWDFVVVLLRQSHEAKAGLDSLCST